MRRLLSFCCASAFVSASAVPGHPQTTPPNYCQSAPIRADALDFPSKHAWDLFLMLSHPAVDRQIERGRADCTKPIGTPGTTAVWETWRNAGKGEDVPGEVFLKDGKEPPHWNDNEIKDYKPGGVPSVTIAAFTKRDIPVAKKSPPFTILH